MRKSQPLGQGRPETCTEETRSRLRQMAAFSILCLLFVPIAFGQGTASSEDLTFEPTWDSVQTHQVPEWFHDAKLVIFPVWGLYSVPGWAPTTGELGKVDWDTCTLTALRRASRSWVDQSTWSGHKKVRTWSLICRPGSLETMLKH